MLDPNSPYAQLLARQRSGEPHKRQRSPKKHPAQTRRLGIIMSQEARNDLKAQRLIEMLYGEGVSPENITRLLNYHFADTHQHDKDDRTQKSVIRRVPDGHNFAPSVELWKQP